MREEIEVYKWGKSDSSSFPCWLYSSATMFAEGHVGVVGRKWFCEGDIAVLESNEIKILKEKEFNETYEKIEVTVKNILKKYECSQDEKPPHPFEYLTLKKIKKQTKRLLKKHKKAKKLRIELNWKPHGYGAVTYWYELICDIPGKDKWKRRVVTNENKTVVEAPIQKKS